MITCDGCGGEDCACCEIYLDDVRSESYLADELYEDEFRPIEYDFDDEDEW